MNDGYQTLDDVKDDPPRRNFLVEFWAIAVGGFVGLFPALTGLAVLLDPLRKTKASEGPTYVPITRLDAVPADGMPRQFPVIKDRTDAWTFSPDQRVGAVFLIRQPDSESITAFNVVCPHAGCFVGFDNGNKLFQCPCHTSAFELDGSIIKPSPSPRDMDSLKTKVEDGWVQVAFANYLPGKHEMIEK